MANFETSLLYGEIPKKLPKELKAVSANYKKGEFKHGAMFGRVSKIPIANTPNELTEMAFPDYGDFATFLHIRGTFSRFAAAISRGRNRKKDKRPKRFGEKRFRIGQRCLGRLELSLWIKIPDLMGGFSNNFAPSAI